jgi:hypothetical protein
MYTYTFCLEKKMMGLGLGFRGVYYFQVMGINFAKPISELNITSSIILSVLGESSNMLFTISLALSTAYPSGAK